MKKRNNDFQFKKYSLATLSWLAFKVFIPAISLIGFVIMLWLSGYNGDSDLKQQIFYMTCGDIVAFAMSIVANTFESSYKQKSVNKGFPFWCSLFSLFFLIFVSALYFIKPINYYIKADRIEEFLIVMGSISLINTGCGLYLDEYKAIKHGDEKNENS